MQNILWFFDGFGRGIVTGTVAIAYAVAVFVGSLARVSRWALITALALFAMPFMLAGLACVVVVLVLALPFCVIVK